MRENFSCLTAFELGCWSFLASGFELNHWFLLNFKLASIQTRAISLALLSLQGLPIADLQTCQPPQSYELSSYINLFLYLCLYLSIAEAPILRPTDVMSQLIGKDPGAGKNWRKEEKEVTEDEMIGWHHQLNGYEFEQSPRDSEGQRSLACYSPWDHQKLDMTWGLNNNLNNKFIDSCTIAISINICVYIYVYL